VNPPNESNAQVAGMLAHAKGRSEDVVNKLRQAMAAIEIEIDAHAGIYPFNGGRLSQAEVCRRAGVKPITLLGPAHKETTKVELDEWLARVTSQTVKGKKSVRRAVTDRATEWKEQLEKIATQYHLAELRMVGLAARVAELEAENAALREAMRSGPVVGIRPKGK